MTDAKHNSDASPEPLRKVQETLQRIRKRNNLPESSPEDIARTRQILFDKNLTSEEKKTALLAGLNQRNAGIEQQIPSVLPVHILQHRGILLFINVLLPIIVACPFVFITICEIVGPPILHLDGFWRIVPLIITIFLMAFGAYSAVAMDRYQLQCRACGKPRAISRNLLMKFFEHGKCRCKCAYCGYEWVYADSEARYDEMFPPHLR